MFVTPVSLPSVQLAAHEAVANAPRGVSSIDGFQISADFGLPKIATHGGKAFALFASYVPTVLANSQEEAIVCGAGGLTALVGVLFFFAFLGSRRTS